MNSSNSFIHVSEGCSLAALTVKLAQEQSGTTEYSIALQKMWRSHLSLLPGMISVYFQSCGWYIQRTWVLCSHQADFSHNCRSVLHSFSSFVLILFCNSFPCSYWSSFFHPKKGKYLFDRNTPEECEGLQELWAQGSRNADCSAVSHKTFAVLGRILLLACTKYSPLTHHQTPGSESRELERAPWFRETHPNLTSATSLHRPFPEFLSWSSSIPIPQQR